MIKTFAMRNPTVRLLVVSTVLIGLSSCDVSPTESNKQRDSQSLKTPSPSPMVASQGAFNERVDGTFVEKQSSVTTLSDQAGFAPDTKASGGRFLDFDNYQAYYTVFPSTFIPADIAAKAGLKRGKRLHYMNILVSPAGKYGGVPSTVSGQFKNLMQQAGELNFTEIKEKDTVYYLAPFKIQGEDTLHFDLDFVLPDGRSVSDTFSTKVYP